MKAKFLFLILFIGLTTVSLAQYQVKGRVLDQNGEALPGVTVSISNPSLTEGDITDAKGSFSIDIAEKGNYDAQLRFVGFKVQTLRLEIANATTYDLGEIRLEESEVQLQTVEIIGRARTDYNSDYSFSASKIAIKNKELPQALTTVTKELMADRLAFQLPEAVKTVSNVSVTGLYNHYNIRGITQGDDGQVINGMRTRQYYFLQPITSHLERVEVIKGPASVTFF